jgi:hypothetical protein
VEASQAYLALDIQLRAELPRYIEILEKGFTVCLKQFSDWQARFWREVRAQWVELWDALGIEGDMSAGAPETIKVWWERWEEIDAAAVTLGITKNRHDRSSRGSATIGPTAALATAFVSGAGTPLSMPTTPLYHHRQSMQSIDLEIEKYLPSYVRSVLGSPNETIASSPDSSGSHNGIQRRDSRASRESSQKWEHVRPSLSHPNSNDRLGTAGRESDGKPLGRNASFRDLRPSTARPEDMRPSTAHPDGVGQNRTKPSLDISATRAEMSKLGFVLFCPTPSG